jgi:redox-sensitive bicupin YhaK (pirin superfamily)
MLQIFVRPREADLPALVNFYERPDGAPSEKWGFVAAPEGSAAPLTIRNEVRVYDVHLHEGSEIDVPAAEGMAPFLYVLDGAIEVGDQRLGKGDGISDDSGALPPVAALGDATLVLFLVNRSARASRAGTISGR